MLQGYEGYLSYVSPILVLHMCTMLGLFLSFAGPEYGLWGKQDQLWGFLFKLLVIRNLGDNLKIHPTKKPQITNNGHLMKINPT